MSDFQGSAESVSVDTGSTASVSSEGSSQSAPTSSDPNYSSSENYSGHKFEIPSDFETAADKPSEAEAQPVEAPETTEAIEEVFQPLKFKRHGKEIVISNRQDAEKYLSVGYDADTKWQEAAALNRQNQQFLRAFLENPVEILKNPQLGLDAHKIALQILEQQVDEELMSPEEKQYKEMQRELETYRREKAEAQAREQERIQKEADEKFERETTDAVKNTLKEAGLPHTNFTWSTTLQYMAAAMDAGHANVTAADVMPFVRRDYQRSMEEMYNLPPEELIKTIGEANINKIQQAVIQKTRGKPVSSSQPGHAQAQAANDYRSTYREGMSDEEWKASIREAMRADGML